MAAVLAPQFPPASSVSTVALAVGAVGYVLANTAPYVRNFRDAGGAWRQAQTASRDALAKMLALQASMSKAQASVEHMTEQVAEASAAVGFVLSLRAELIQFANDLESAVLAIETAQAKIKALKKYRAIIVRSSPGFDEAIASFETGTAELGKMRETAETLMQGHYLEQIDHMLEIANQAAVHETLRLAREMAYAKPRPTPAEAIQSLEAIHAYAQAHGIKF